MNYGLHILNFGPYGDARVLAELAHEAEDAGWDGFFLWDQVAKTTLTPTIDRTRCDCAAHEQHPPGHAHYSASSSPPVESSP